MSVPPLTIAVNNLNDGRFLPDVLDSCRAQTRKAFEILGIDAGSTDDSLDVFRRYHVPVIHCGGLNQPQSVNRAIEQTRSDYFAWINADDVYCPNFVATHLDAFAGDPPPDVVHSDCEFFWHEVPGRAPYLWRSHTALEHMAAGDNRIAHPTTMIRRSLFDRIGLFDETILYPFDFEFWLRAAAAGAVFCHLPEVTARYRVRKDNLTATKHREIVAELEQLHRRYNWSSSTGDTS